MPSDEKKRAEELNRMHQNYGLSEFTLIHDLQLANLEWKDDGSPCLALALSGWFTRGWTALELRASKKVKVLFKAPAQLHGQTALAAGFTYQFNGLCTYHYVLKDLDEDILAGEKDHFANAAHREASHVIQTVRGRAQQDLTELNQLMFALKHRHTSKARDRMIIAGLMKDPGGLGSDLEAANITKKILRENITRITPHSLFHSNGTMCWSGPWSWCPAELLDLAEDEEGYDSFLSIVDGTLRGRWAIKTPTQEELQTLSPVGPRHPLVWWCLEHPEGILILDKLFGFFLWG